MFCIHIIAPSPSPFSLIVFAITHIRDIIISSLFIKNDDFLFVSCGNIFLYFCRSNDSNVTFPNVQLPTQRKGQKMFLPRSHSENPTWKRDLPCDWRISLAMANPRTFLWSSFMTESVNSVLIFQSIVSSKNLLFLPFLQKLIFAVFSTWIYKCSFL